MVMTHTQTKNQDRRPADGSEVEKHGRTDGWTDTTDCSTLSSRLTRCWLDADAAAETATVRSVVKGEMSAKTTHQRSAKGPTSIGDCSADGKFVTLENTGRRVRTAQISSRQSPLLSCCFSGGSTLGPGAQAPQIVARPSNCREAPNLAVLLTHSGQLILRKKLVNLRPAYVRF